MDKLLNITIAAAAAAIVAVGAITVMYPAAVPNNGLNDGRPLGALAGPDIASPYLTWGDVPSYNAGPTIAATSSVICSYQAHSTSTIDMLGIKVTGNGLGAAQTLDISTSTSQYGSSSPAFIKAFSVSASPGVANPDIVAWQPNASSSVSVVGTIDSLANGGTPYILKKGDWVTWRIATGTPTSNAGQLSGNCTLKTTVL